MNSERLATVLEKVLDIGNLLNEGELVASRKRSRSGRAAGLLARGSGVWALWSTALHAAVGSVSWQMRPCGLCCSVFRILSRHESQSNLAPILLWYIVRNGKNQLLLDGQQRKSQVEAQGVTGWFSQ